ncbi:fibronectin type III domain protein, partial [Candidatus Magnetomorum sp. HK-1]
TANYPVTALDMDNQTIIAGLGSHGIAVFETSLLSVNASSLMDFSGQSMIFSSTDNLPLKLNIPEGINAVNYLLGDTVIAKTTTPPFSFNAPVPATLHNGQTFHIQAIIETHSGEIFTSKAYTANVYTQSLPENTIEISLIINNDYLPLPVNIHSAVTSTIYPISHIEIYKGKSPNESFEQIQQYQGPVVDLDYQCSTDAHNHYLFARAIDIFGNVGKSSMVQIKRIIDREPPAIPEIWIEGHLNNGQPVEGYPFTVHLEINDLESGVDQAILYRNGQMVAARFDQGEIVFYEENPTSGESFQYSVVVVDRAGNENNRYKQWVMSNDHLPVIHNIQAPSSIIEQSEFSVDIQCSDDVGITFIDLLWNGIHHHFDLDSMQQNIEKTFNITDLRNQPIESVFTEQLIINITDSNNQNISRSFSIQVMPDNPPDTSKLVVYSPQYAFFNSNITISIEDIHVADDCGYQQLNLDIIDITSDQPKPVYSTSGETIIKTILRSPVDDTYGNLFQFYIRLTDRLGQTNDSSVYNVHLNQMPNQIFFDHGGNNNLNPSFITSNELLSLQVQILDTAGQPIPNQSIPWYIQNGPGIQNQYLESSSTDINGLAQLNLSGQRMAGAYVIRSEIADVQLLFATHSLNILTGKTDHIVIDYLPPVPASESTAMVIKAHDTAHNFNYSDSHTVVDFFIPHAAFNVGFSSQISTESVYENEIFLWAKKLLLSLKMEKPW